MRLILLVLFIIHLQANAAYEALVQVGNQVFLTEIRRTPAERARGYQYRIYIPPFAAMLFVFEGEEALHFWMKDTFQALEMRFFDGAGRLVQRYPEALPCRVRDCPIYSSIQPAAYVLEHRPHLGQPDAALNAIYLIKP